MKLASIVGKLGLRGGLAACFFVLALLSNQWKFSEMRTDKSEAIASESSKSTEAQVETQKLIGEWHLSEQWQLSGLIDLVGTSSYANRAIESEAKTYTSAMNRSQQAFFSEMEYFAKNLTELSIGISSQTENYSYQVVVLDNKKGAQSFGLALKDGLKSYTGLVYPKAILAVGEGTTLFSLLCESKKPTKARPPLFKLTPEPTCPEGYVLLKY